MPERLLGILGEVSAICPGVQRDLLPLLQQNLGITQVNDDFKGKFVNGRCSPLAMQVEPANTARCWAQAAGS